ncbi:hypothetical protein LB465_17835 [Salegentibacter sp. LM13S]|nr:hypothetical protein [Salegentibacter lacus]MBZ9632643.1 hypothetical protein [Salegentibacter lacus]
MKLIDPELENFAPELKEKLIKLRNKSIDRPKTDLKPEYLKYHIAFFDPV